MSNPRRGASLVEIICLIGIISLVSSVLIPAVQAAREAARRMACVNHLRQIGLATCSYGALHGVMPATDAMSNISPDWRAYMWKEYSVFAFILPELEHGSVFNSINFDVEMVNPYTTARPAYPWQGAEANATCIACKLSVLICPSDSAPLVAATGETNYRASLGTSHRGAWANASNGALSPVPTPISPASITDGLSQTVSFSEKSRGRPRHGSDFDPGRDIMLIPFYQSRVQAFIDSCNQVAADPSSRFWDCAGQTWLASDLTQTTYNHIYTPNSESPDCARARSPGPNPGIYAARSEHPGGVNAAYADGSVRFARSGIAPAVWKALGTRSGGEIVTGE